VRTVEVLIAQFRVCFYKKKVIMPFLWGHVLPSGLTLASVSQRYVGIFLKFGMGGGYFAKRFRANLGFMSFGWMTVIILVKGFDCSVSDIHMSVHRKIIKNYSQQDAMLLEFIDFYRCSTCFRRFLRPSS